MKHTIIYEIIGDGAGLSAEDAQSRLAAMQPAGAVTSDLAPPERKEPDSMRRCPMAPLGRGHWMEPELQRHHQSSMGAVPIQ